MNSNLKNMIILKSLPSNIIDEAIIILKENVKIKEVEKNKIKEKNSENKSEKNNNEKQEENEKYIIKEAELIVNNYVENLEKKDENKANKKEKNIKKIMYLTLAISIIEMIFLIIK